MDKFQENEFYKDNGWPTEYLEYCQYRFLQDSVTEFGHDYDQFAIVANAVYPYIRLTQKIGRIHTPCGGSSQIACDGNFATKSDAERDEECPKIAWGIAAVFLSHLRYDNGQQDFVLMKQKDEICKSYYESYLRTYLDKHNSLKYEKISSDQKEIDFIAEHLPLIKDLWAKSTPLKKYHSLYAYAEEMEFEYENYVVRRRNDALKRMNPMRNSFSTEIRVPFENKPCIKVFFLDDSVAEDARNALAGVNCIKNVNVTPSASKDHPGNTLTVYPKSMVSAEECEKEVKTALDTFFSKVQTGVMNVRNEAFFANIERQILELLDQAEATVVVCVAWFTNDKLRDKLLELQAKDVDVRVITYKDGVNHQHGVDLTGIPHKEYRGERGGLLHDKFCVIDNVNTICGSYNWTRNAEDKNDEDATFHKEDYRLASQYTKRFNQMWKRDGQE